MAVNWQLFWQNYRKIDPQSEDDLFFQVGKTSNQKPIPQVTFQKIIFDIVTNLDLKKGDTLLEMCCGNGLFTYELINFVKSINAFDFTESLIESANKFKSHNNITYAIGDANDDFESIFDVKLPIFTKYLMNDATAYFTPEQLNDLIKRIQKKSTTFSLYLTNIPNDSKKWNFYNTIERKENYENSLKKGDVFLGGMGRWWKIEEFEELALQNDLEVQFIDTNDELNYRVNVLFKKNI